MVIWSILHDDTHDLRDAVIDIAQGFTGNALSITLGTKEYADNREILGWLHQYSGLAVKRYPIFTADEVLSLIVPFTDSLQFFPSRFLSRVFTLKIAYANIANGAPNGNASTSIPAIILGLPDRVTAIEAIPPLSLSATNTAIGALQLSETSQNTAIGTIQTNVANLSLLVSNPQSSNTILLAVDSILQSFKSYFASGANLTFTLPASPSIGDSIEISTGDYDLNLKHGNGVQRVLNNNTQTLIGASSGLILKPYSTIALTFNTGNLWVSKYRHRTINNYSLPSIGAEQFIPVTLSAVNAVSQFGTNLGMIQNGIKTPTGSLNDGYLSSQNFLNLVVTANTPFVLSRLKLWTGQGNVNSGATSYRVDQVIAYDGSLNTSPILSTRTFANTSAVEQDRLIANTAIAKNAYLLAFTSAVHIGILELECFGMPSLGSETSVI